MREIFKHPNVSISWSGTPGKTFVSALIRAPGHAAVYLQNGRDIDREFGSLAAFKDWLLHFRAKCECGAEIFTPDFRMCGDCFSLKGVNRALHAPIDDRIAEAAIATAERPHPWEAWATASYES